MSFRVIQWLALMAPYQEESSENKMVGQIVILASRYPYVFFSFGLTYHGDAGDTCCVRHDVNPIPVTTVL
jgi:hypothetical protein